ncbi:T3SS effector OspC family protein [Chromobacterium sp. CV08]|uniref:T3SS effector OspC family protein n=1 Tax=Chromobacterium sp. CV08 TaxID=3133274 RepID=UPI003DA7E308
MRVENHSPSLAKLNPPEASVGDPTAIGRSLCGVSRAPLQHAAAGRDGEAVAVGKIGAFLRKAVAAQSYGLMFANGKLFEATGDALEKREQYGFSALKRLDGLSRRNLDAVEARLGALDAAELGLKERIMAGAWHFRHQSNAALDDGEKATIASNHLLSRQSRSSGSNTFAADKERLSNHDFVFFGVEFSGRDRSDKPLNHKHSTMDFGANAYVVSDTLPVCRNGYLTLTDHFFNLVPGGHEAEHQDFIKRFPQMGRESGRWIHEGKYRQNAPVFSYGDMKAAVALHLIEFLRSSQDEAFKAYVFDQAMQSGPALDRVLNSVFQAEFHIPRLMATTDYAKHPLRPMLLKEAVDSVNLPVLSGLVSNKGDAVTAMWHAIDKGKDEVAAHLLDNWQFEAKDFSSAPPGFYYELNYALSKGGASLYILDQFLSRGWAAVNAPFEHVNRGETMLDNAVKYDSREMVAALIKHGADRNLLSESHRDDLDALLA